MAVAKDDWVEIGGGEAWDGQGIIEGTYVHKATNVGPNQSNMYTIRTAKAGDLGVWGSTVLDSKFEQILIGDEVRIESLGLSDKAAPGKKPYKQYKVLSRPGSGTPVPVAEKVELAEDVEELNDLDY